MEATKKIIGGILKSFLAEDLGYGDITTDSLINPQAKASGEVVCKEPAVIAGFVEAQALLEIVGCTGTPLISEGQRITAGTTILRVAGPAGSLLKVERTMLNLLSHMSGVATATSELVELANKSGGGRVIVACTRKTTPGLRYFEKRAVAVGGGDTHRLRLDDAVLIKDNHLALAGTITDCIKKARRSVSFTKKVEVEVTKPQEAVEAAEAGADIILLDNMKPDRVREIVAELEAKKLRSKVLLEASGGIRRENLANYAGTGVDVISVGAITHSARSIDISLELIPTSRKHR